MWKFQNNQFELKKQYKQVWKKLEKVIKFEKITGKIVMAKKMVVEIVNIKKISVKIGKFKKIGGKIC